LLWYDGTANTFVVIDTDGGTGGGGTTNQDPVASFTYAPSDPVAGETITFDASDSYDPDGSIVSYEWDWISDGDVDATGVTADRVYTSSGQRTVTLVVTDDGEDGAGTNARTGTALQTLTIGERPITTLDDFEHRDYQRYYSESNSAVDWRFVTDTRPGSSGNYSIECTTSDSRYLVTYPGDGLGSFDPGQTARLWFKPNGSGGAHSLWFATSQPAQDNRYSMDYNDSTGRAGIRRFDAGIEDPLSITTGVSINTSSWHAFEVGYFPDGGDNLPWAILDSDLNVVAEDQTSSDNSGNSLRTSTALGWGIRSNITDTRFDDAIASDSGF
jgi:hypothetical protein